MGRNPKDDIRKPQILAHFRQVINEEGLPKASNAKVAKHMGVSTNLVAHYFESKEAMVQELIELSINEYTDYLSDSVGNLKDPGDHLKAKLKAMFCAEENKHLLYENTYYALYNISLINKKFKQKFMNIYNEHRKIFINEIQSAMDSGKIKQGDPEKLAELILSLFEGFTFLANLRENGNHFEELGEYFYQKSWAILNEGDSNI